MAKDDGGPAFPSHDDGAGMYAPEHYSGMSLRDYFAAKALVGEMVTTLSDATPDAAEAFLNGAAKAGHTPDQHLAFNAYQIADAMLAERKK